MFKDEIFFLHSTWLHFSIHCARGQESLAPMVYEMSNVIELTLQCCPTIESAPE